VTIARKEERGKERPMRDRVWWKQLHWFEYGAELLGTAFLVFAGVSAPHMPSDGMLRKTA
jgi:hypothetical protein